MRRGACGTRAHKTTIKPINDTSLCTKHSSSATPPHTNSRERATHSGCSPLIPVFDAIAPVMNGNTAAPAAPQLPVQPIAPEIQSGGRMRPAWFMRMGNMGPRKKPTKETQIAPDNRLGTSHTTSSSLMEEYSWSARVAAGAVRGMMRHVPDDRENVDEDDASLTYLSSTLESILDSLPNKLIGPRILISDQWEIIKHLDSAFYSRFYSLERTLHCHFRALMVRPP